MTPSCVTSSPFSSSHVGRLSLSIGSLTTFISIRVQWTNLPTKEKKLFFVDNHTLLKLILSCCVYCKYSVEHVQIQLHYYVILLYLCIRSVLCLNIVANLKFNLKNAVIIEQVTHNTCNKATSLHNNTILINMGTICGGD